jgi:hypothetical protein
VQDAAANVLKQRLGQAYTPRYVRPQTLKLLNACVGRFEESIGDDPHDSEWMWADAEERQLRKRLKVSPPPSPPRSEVVASAAAYMRNPSGKPPRAARAAPATAVGSKEAKPGEHEPPLGSSGAEPLSSGTGQWLPAKSDELIDSEGRHGGLHFKGMRLGGGSPDSFHEASASPQPVAWLQQPPLQPHLPAAAVAPAGHAHPASVLLPPCAPQYAPAAPSYDMGYELYSEIPYKGPVPSHVYPPGEDFPPPLPSDNEAPPPLPDDSPPPLPDSSPPPLPDSEPPPLPEDPFRSPAAAQVCRSSLRCSIQHEGFGC